MGQSAPSPRSQASAHFLGSTESKLKMRAHVIKSCIQQIVDARLAVQKARNWRHQHFIDSLVEEVSDTLRSVLRKMFNSLTQNNRRDWRVESDQLAQMEDDLRIELANINRKLHSWQTKPLKAKIDMVKQQTFLIRHAAQRATPQVQLKRDILEEGLAQALSIKFDREAAFSSTGS